MFALGIANPATQWDIGDAEKMWYNGVELTGSDPSTATWTYPMRDHLGTPRASYGQTRNLLSKNEYSPYGIPEVSLGQPSPIGYTGHYHDSESNLNYAPYRYYNPQTTRWLKRDPLGMIDGPNMYAYVEGNPIDFRDFWGLNAEEAGDPCTEKCKQSCQDCCDKKFGEAISGIENPYDKLKLANQRQCCYMVCATVPVGKATGPIGEHGWKLCGWGFEPPDPREDD